MPHFSKCVAGRRGHHQPEATLRRVVWTALISIAIATATAPAAGAYLAPAPASRNVQVDTRDPSQPSVDFRSPVVVINPTNPNNVVVASRNDQPDYFCHVNYSFDGGKTWAPSTGTGPTFPDPPVPVGKSPPGTCWSPGAAFDAQGSVYVVAQDRPSGGGSPQTVIVWKSTDGGRRFGAPVTIPASTSSGFSVQSDIAVDRARTSPHFGRIYVTWHEFPNQQNLYVQLIHSDDGGQTWSAPVNRKLPGPTGRSESIPELAVAPDGTVYDLFKGRSPFRAGTDCAGIGFGAIPPDGTDCPLMLLRSSDGGVGFDGDPVTVGVAHYTDTAVAEEPSIVVTPRGTVLVASATIPNPAPAGCTASLQAVVYRSTDRGQTWSAPKPLNDDPCAAGNSHRDPRLSVAPDGRVDAGFYDSRRDPGHHLFDFEYTNSTDDGLTFGANTRVSDASFDSMLLFTPIASGFQTRDYDTVTGLASTNGGAIAAWGDTRNAPESATDVFSSRISFAAPVVSGYRLTNSTFVVGGGRTPTVGVAAKVSRRTRKPKPHKQGTTFKYTLSEAATVKIVVTERFPGRRHGRRCVAPTRRLRNARRCTRIIVKGTLTRTSAAGANTVAFSGRIGSKPLRPGRYQATLTATNSANDTSKRQTVNFRIVNR